VVPGLHCPVATGSPFFSFFDDVGGGIHTQKHNNITLVQHHNSIRSWYLDSDFSRSTYIKDNLTMRFSSQNINYLTCRVLGVTLTWHPEFVSRFSEHRFGYKICFVVTNCYIKDNNIIPYGFQFEILTLECLDLRGT